MKIHKTLRKAIDLSRRIALTASVAAATLLTGSMIATGPVYANDIIVHPASCRATFLDQAFPMRWHEHFLMNPDTNQGTYIICPMGFDPDVVNLSAGSFNVTVFGGIMSGASGSLPACVFKIHDRRNLKQGVYIDRSPTLIYSQGMTSQTNGTQWAATLTTTRAAVATELGNNDLSQWAISTVCFMEPGYSVTQIWLND